jgi:alpha-tubulin suppressor-like RCC1 family protein
VTDVLGVPDAVPQLLPDKNLESVALGDPDSVDVKEPLAEPQKVPDVLCVAEEVTKSVADTEIVGLELNEGEPLCEGNGDAEKLEDTEEDAVEEPRKEPDSVTELVKVATDGDAKELSEGEWDEV